MIERTFSSARGAQGYSFPENTVPAIIGFNVGWTRDDHHIRWLSVGPQNSAPLNSGEYLIALRDDDRHRHNINGYIKLVDLSAIADHREVSLTSVVGEQRLRIPHLIGSQAFVLTGFYFRYRHSDNHLLQVKVRQMAHNDHIYVNIRDNDGANPYDVYITYAVLSRSVFRDYGLILRSSRPVRSSETVSRAPGQAFLQSFELKFRNGDHHLQRMTIDLDDDQLLVGLRDNDGNDPFTWMVEYAVLR